MYFQDIQPDGELPVTLGRRQPAIPRPGSGWSILKPDPGIRVIGPIDETIRLKASIRKSRWGPLVGGEAVCLWLCPPPGSAPRNVGSIESQEELVSEAVDDFLDQVGRGEQPDVED